MNAKLFSVGDRVTVRGRPATVLTVTNETWPGRFTEYAKFCYDNGDAETLGVDRMGDVEPLNTVSIEIPSPPDGMEVFLNTGRQNAACDAFCNNGVWMLANKGEKSGHYVLARRKPTLADWANEQPDFQALAKCLKAYQEHRNTLSTQAETLPHGQWTFCDRGDVVFYPTLTPPPKSIEGRLKLEGGKWVDA